MFLNIDNNVLIAVSCKFVGLVRVAHHGDLSVSPNLVTFTIGNMSDFSGDLNYVWWFSVISNLLQLICFTIHFLIKLKFKKIEYVWQLFIDKDKKWEHKNYFQRGIVMVWGCMMQLFMLRSNRALLILGPLGSLISCIA